MLMLNVSLLLHLGHLLIFNNPKLHKADVSEVGLSVKNYKTGLAPVVNVSLKIHASLDSARIFCYICRIII